MTAARRATDGAMAWVLANATALRTIGTIALGIGVLLIAWGGKADERRFVQHDAEIRELREASRANIEAQQRTNESLQTLAREVSRLVGRMDAKP